jgi:hypothetical protein
MIGWCTISSEWIRSPASFQRILVVWPSATSLTSRSTSSLRWRFLPGDGLQQAKDYAQILDLKFAYSTNGPGIVEHDY